MSAPARQREQEPQPHPERVVSGPATVLLAGSDVVRGFTTHRDAVTAADLFVLVHGTRLEVHPAGCDRARWWAVLPPDPAWREQVRARGRVHAHEVTVVTARSLP